MTSGLPPDPEPWSSGLSWNYVALIFIALAGLVSNVLIAKEFGPVGLGVFSQTLTWFALMAQVAALGIHYSVLQQTASATTTSEARYAVDSGLTLVAAIATAAAMLSFLIAPLVGEIAQSTRLAGSVRIASVALVFHGLVKVVAAGLNGSRRMKAFSAVNAARAAGLLAAVIVLSGRDSPASELGFTFVASEAAALIAALASWGRVRPRLGLDHMRRLLSFGVRAAMAALTVEANSRIDIAVLGIASSDEVVGIYALAATAFEGASQVFVVLRNQVNPAIATAVSEDRPEQVDELQRRLRPWVLLVALVLLVLATGFLGPVISVLDLAPSFIEARLPLAILLTALLVVSPLLPFDQLLVMGGEPGRQSLVVFASILVNILVSVALVSLLGGVGVAIGTGCALLTLVIGVSRTGAGVLGTKMSLWSGRLQLRS